MAPFRISPQLWERIHHFAGFPQTGVSLQQMVLFGKNPTPGTLLKGGQFLAGNVLFIPPALVQSRSPHISEELPIRLAHRVKELDTLPHNLSAMPSINVVKNWYAQSFEVSPPFDSLVSNARSNDACLPLSRNSSASRRPPYPATLCPQHPTPSLLCPLYLKQHRTQSIASCSVLPYPRPMAPPDLTTACPQGRVAYAYLWSGGSSWYFFASSTLKLIFRLRRFYTVPNISTAAFPPELHAYNRKFTKTLENIKRRHDPTVTTVAQGVLEWKRQRGKSAASQETPREIQEWLDRFYMSRIGIRFLIGQR